MISQFQHEHGMNMDFEHSNIPTIFIQKFSPALPGPTTETGGHGNRTITEFESSS